MEKAMKNSLKTAVALTVTAILAGHAAAEVTFYQRDSFGGRAFTTYSPISDLARYGLNDRASSVIVDRQRYEVCEDAGYRGHCVILRPGSYPSLAAMGLNNQVSSVRPIAWNVRVDDHRYAPPPVLLVDYRRRGSERLYEANVVAVRAVVGPPEQRCWIERERVPDGPNVGGAVVGAVIGGILGHQIGAGSGRDAATVGGAVAGAAIGANVDDGRPNTTRVQRCANVRGDERPDYWDVIYTFRGAEHHVQMERPPGRTVTVNQYGEPRAN
jgi:uncharacterized protein YcfJ